MEDKTFKNHRILSYLAPPFTSLWIYFKRKRDPKHTKDLKEDTIQATMLGTIYIITPRLGYELYKSHLFGLTSTTTLFIYNIIRLGIITLWLKTLFEAYTGQKVTIPWITKWTKAILRWTP